jgi:flavodoxin I
VSRIGLFYGSDEGNTESIAFRIQARLGEDTVEIIDIADATQLEFANFDKLILGIPTWDFGQLQSDWEDFWQDIAEVDMNGKTVALFGLGDQFGYGDYFIDSVGMLHDVIISNGPKIIGHWSTDGYEYEASKAKIDGEEKFVGLAIDEDQQEHLTAGRLDEWCAQIHAEFALQTDLLTVDD